VVAWKWRRKKRWVEAPKKMGNSWTLKLLSFHQDLFSQSKSAKTPTQNDDLNIKCGFGHQTWILYHPLMVLETPKLVNIWI
jgi:hypothetical protein